MHPRVLFIFFTLFFSIFHFSVSSQVFTLVKDINYGNPGRCEGSQGQPIQHLMNVNNSLYFTTSSGSLVTPSGLWKSDGSVAGTVLIKGDLFIESIINVNGILFFVRNVSGTGNQELWKSDGTETGTTMIKTFSGLISHLTHANGIPYFKVFTSGIGDQLWKTDGTEAGTQLIQTFSSLEHLTPVNGVLFFSATTAPLFTFGLWKSDGTAAGTVMVKDNIRLNNGYATSGPFYFVADDGISGYELWKSDGTASGTVLVKDLEPGANGSDPRNFTIVNNVFYFFAVTSANGVALWKTDGTQAGTTIVKEVQDATNLINVNGTLFFTGYEDVHGAELWKSDGTTAGTALLKDIFPGDFWSFPTNFVEVNGTLYFSAQDEELPPGTQINCSFPGELWKSDGTEAGTVMVKDIYAGAGTGNPSKLVNINGTLFFTANNGLNGTELWKSNGTGAATTMVIDFFTTGNSNPNSFTLMNGVVYFSAFDAHSGPGIQIKGTEMHRTDGTLSGTYQVADIFGLGSSFPNQFTNVNGTLYFSANNGSHGFELFKSDGLFSFSSTGTSMVKDINPLFGTAPDRGSNPTQLTPISNTLYFSAMDGTNGFELWKTDGTEPGTVMVKHINPGPNGSDPGFLVVLNNVLYFAADNGTGGRELWKSDGTDAGTVMIKDINVTTSSNPAFLTVMNDAVYFTANDGSNGTELWKTDGTAAGTLIVKNINPGVNGSSPAQLKNVNGALYFIADNGTNGVELWKSDGTDAGTLMVKDINPGANSSSPVSLTNLNGIVYFSADNGVAGREVWRSDGTEAATVLIKDINPGGGSDPELLTRVANTVMFTANDGVSGAEVWVTNGTETGTRMMAEIETGPGGSGVTEIFEYGAKVLVAAATSTTGSEVWIADAPPDSPLPLQLLEFKGIVSGNDGILQWKTENEVNTSSFVVDRSIDGRNYSPIGSATAANTPGIHYYDFTDANIVSFGVRNIYYRLRLIDIDGRYTYSNIIVLSLVESRPIVLLYPNPAMDKLNLTITVSQPERLNWQLSDNSGRTVKTGVYNVSPGSTAVSIDIAGLSSGIYIMQIRGSSLQRVIKVLKQ